MEVLKYFFLKFNTFTKIFKKIRKLYFPELSTLLEIFQKPFEDFPNLYFSFPCQNTRLSFLPPKPTSIFQHGNFICSSYFCHRQGYQKICIKGFFDLFSILITHPIFTPQKFNLTNFTSGLENPIDVAYESYKDWLKTHQDLQLGANLMTDKQLFWVARGVVEYRKIHRVVPFLFQALGNSIIGFSFEHDFRRSKKFQEAFGCEKIEEEKLEGKKFEELSIFGIDLSDLEEAYDGFKFLG